MKIHQSRSDRVFDGVNVFFLTVILCLTLYPLIYVLSASVSEPARVMNGEVILLPRGFSATAYAKVFKNNDIWLGYGNTILYTLVGTAINLVMTFFGAYPLSKKDLWGRKVISLLLLFTMYFSGGMIPTYLIIKQLRLVDTFWVMVLPGAIATYNLIVMRTYFVSSIPGELFEAAEIDGAGVMRTIFHVVLPLSIPILAVMVLFYAVGHWNSYFNALIYLNSRARYPLQIFLREIVVQNQFSDMMDTTEGFAEQAMLTESIKYCTIVVASVPMLILYPFITKYFTKGVMLGAIKG